MLPAPPAPSSYMRHPPGPSHGPHYSAAGIYPIADQDVRRILQTATIDDLFSAGNVNVMELVIEHRQCASGNMRMPTSRFLPQF